MLSLYRKLGFATFVALAMLTAAITTGATVAPAQASPLMGGGGAGMMNPF